MSLMLTLGLPEIDEPSMMEDVVKELQAVIDLPLQLDTSSAEAMERGLRVYNGKPLINSVNGKKRGYGADLPAGCKIRWSSCRALSG